MCNYRSDDLMLALNYSLVASMIIILIINTGLQSSKVVQCT